LPRIYNEASGRQPQQHNNQIISDLHFVSASASDGLESAITNYNHSEQSRCISATFLF